MAVSASGIYAKIMRYASVGLKSVRCGCAVCVLFAGSSKPAPVRIRKGVELAQKNAIDAPRRKGPAPCAYFRGIHFETNSLWQLRQPFRLLSALIYTRFT